MKNILLILFLFFAKNLFAQQVHFRTDVGNLRLRTEPNLQSKVIKELPKGEVLTYLEEKSKTKETLDWRGQKVSDYWYKVQFTFNKDSVAWVFGAGIKFDGLDYDGIYTNNLIHKRIDNQWIKVDTVSKGEFDKLRIVPMTWKPYKDKYLKKDDGTEKIVYKEFTLNFKNGKSKKYQDDPRETEYGIGLIFLGEIEELNFYFVCAKGVDCGYENAILKNDGKNIELAMPYFYDDEYKSSSYFANSKKSIPLFAPDKKTAVCERYCEPGGEDGFELVTFNSESIDFIAEFLHLRPHDFRFITNRIFIAKLNDDQTYLKITLKTQ
jgi:hypothetical protein